MSSNGLYSGISSSSDKDASTIVSEPHLTLITSLKGSSLNTVTLEVKASTFEFVPPPPH